MWRRLAFLAIGLSVAGCSVRDPVVTDQAIRVSGNWQIEAEVDRISGAPLPSAGLKGKGSHANTVWTQDVAMQLSCFNKQPIVRFGFPFKPGSDRSSELSYRFDEKPGRDVEARFLHDAHAVVLEERAVVAQFVSELVTSEQLYIRIRSLNAGRTTAEFKLAGAEAAVRAGFASCPPSTMPQPRRTV